MSERPLQEVDHVSSKVLTIVLVALVAISFGLGGWACGIARLHGPPIEGPSSDALVPVPLLRSSLDHALFGRERPAASPHREAEARLERWGWVDRERELVHMPIEAAIELRLEQEGTR